MSEPFALASYLERWVCDARFDLSASDSQTLPLPALIGLADDEDRRRWRRLGLGYADPRGAPWLRAAIAARHRQLGADDVLACAGAQEAVACVARSVLTAADHAVVVLPIYPPSVRALTAICETTGVALQRPSWTLDLGAIEAALQPNTRLVLINSPNSPTGAALDAATLGELAALCRRRGIWLVNDEVYRQTDCSARIPAPMVADVYERGVSINGLSKGFGLPGLRVGWAACRDRGLLARAAAVKSMLSSCVAAPSEILGHIALKAEARIVARRRTIGRRNHRQLAQILAGMSGLFALDPPRNLAFAFPRYLGREGVDRFCTRLVHEAGVLALPASLWQCELAPTPSDHLRIGLGHASHRAALDPFAAFLATDARRTEAA